MHEVANFKIDAMYHHLSLGAHVIMACRNQQRADAARAEIVNETGNENVAVKILDLASLESVKQFADDINQSKVHFCHFIVSQSVNVEM